MINCDWCKDRLPDVDHSPAIDLWLCGSCSMIADDLEKERGE